MLPVIALVGRPNVGKSTLFNALTRTRDALVADVPGLTRDRKYGYGRLAGHACVVIDTGGLVESTPGGIEKLMAEQTLKAVEEADRVLFVVDARAGWTPQDQHVADVLRRSGKSVLVVANKAEGVEDETAQAEFHRFGFGEPIAISASHQQGLEPLLDRALEGLEKAEPEDAEPAPLTDRDPIRVAVVGRPNVGKSTLINSITGRRIAKTGNEPGITKGQQRIMLCDEIELFDTPGMLWPKIVVPQGGYNLAASGAVGRNAMDEEEVALELLAYLMRYYGKELDARYHIGDIAGLQDWQVMELIGKKRGAMLPGSRINIQKTAELILTDFRSGAIGRLTLERPDEWRAWEKAAKEAAVLRAAEKEAARLEREARVAKAAKRR